MCIICLEFNKALDIRDAQLMIEAARRESGFISEEHLKLMEERLAEMDQKKPSPLVLPSETDS